MFAVSLLVLAFLHPCISYLIAAYRNNSFVLTPTELIVINPNFPFKKVSKFSLDEITRIKIDEKKSMIVRLFAVLVDYYVAIEYKGISKCFFCIGLHPDAFDENFTEDTLDDLYYALKNKGVETQFKFL